jgi:hypothetical protein
MPPNQRQIKRLYALSHAAGLTHAQVKAELLDRYGITSSKALRDFQYEDYCTDLIRRARPEPGAYRDGAYASAPHLREYAFAAFEFGRLWPGDMEHEDAQALTIILDDFRMHRVRDQKLSQRQLDNFIDHLAGFPVEVFRRAASEWLAKHRTQGEQYFIGIMKGMMRDDAHKARAQQTSSLQLIS